jgi:hypothetical protein
LELPQGKIDNQCCPNGLGTLLVKDHATERYVIVGSALVGGSQKSWGNAPSSDAIIRSQAERVKMQQLAQLIKLA